MGRRTSRIPANPQRAADQGGRSSPFNNVVQIKEEQAGKIIDYLAGDGFLTKAVDLRNKAKLPRPVTPATR